MKSSVWGRRHRWHPLDQQPGPKHPRPNPCVFKDRSTGTEYMLTHNSSTDRVSLTSVPARWRAHPWEPILRSPIGPLRLYVENGALAYERVSLPSWDALTIGTHGTDETPVFTFKASEPRIAYRVRADGVKATTCPLSLVKYTGLGTSASAVSELPFGLPFTTTVTSTPAASGDDANEVVSTTSVSISGTTIGMQSDRQSGVRFPGLTIPQGSTIWSASITFNPTSSDSDSAAITLQADDSDDAAAFQASNADISGRTLTTASVNWTPGAWTSGTPYVTGTDDDLDFTSVIQEVVDRAGWASGNDLALIFTRTAGQRIFAAFDHADIDAPTLSVEYHSTDGCTEPAEGEILAALFESGLFEEGLFE